MTPGEAADLRVLAARRMRVAIALTTLTVVTYFGFVLLVAFDKPLLGRVIAPGLSLGIALGAVVIVVAWLLTGAYVYWANRHYDAALDAIRDEKKAP